MTIVEEIRQNPELGAKRLESEYRAGLLTLAMRICQDPGDAAELVNRTFAEVVAGIDNYAEQSAFFGWMSKILVNLHSKDCRRKSNGLEVFPGEVPEMADDEAREAIYRNLDASLLRDAIVQLPPEMRDVVVMRYFMDLPLSRMAKLLSVPEGTVNSRLHYARLALAAKLGVAAKKPGGKAILIALALFGLTALGAGASLAVARLLSPSATNASFVPGAPSPGNAPSLSQTTQETPTMKSRSILSAALGAAFATAATGDTLYLTKSDNSTAFGRTSYNYWDYAAGGTEAPNPANDYVVDKGLTMCFPNGSYPSGGWVWPGNSLRIGTVGGTQGVLAVTRNYHSTHTFNNGGLILAKGRIQPWVANYIQTFTGLITLTAPDSSPFDIMLNDVVSNGHTNMTFAIGGTFQGAAGTAIRVYSNSSGYPAKFNFAPTTCAAFFGTMIVGNGDASKSITFSTDYNKEMPGGFVITTGSRLTSLQGGKSWKVGFMQIQPGASFLAVDASTKWTVGDLDLGAGSTVSMRVNGNNISTLTVTNSLSVAQGAVLAFGGAPNEGTTNAMQWVVMTLPQDKGTIPVENFTLSGLPSFPDALPRYSLSTNAAAGNWQLLLTKTAHDYLAANDDSSTTVSAGTTSACTNAASWTSGEAPHAGVDYFADYNKGGLTAYPVIRTPYQSGAYAFPGDSLTLGNGTQMRFCGKDTAFPLLVLCSNITLPLSMPGVPSHLRGKIHLRPCSDAYPQRFQAYMAGLSIVDAEITGAGTLHVTGQYGSRSPFGDIEFTGLNTNFTGRMKVYSSDKGTLATGTAEYAHERVFVTDARNLGGPLDDFDADSLELADHTVLEARNDVTFDVANRGMTFTGHAGLAAPEGATLAIMNDITWNAAVRKTGEGTLAIGGNARVASGASPSLAIEEGFLQALSTNAVNGVYVSFADGAYLLVDPAATGDLAAYGAVDLSAAPFGGSLPVALTLPDPAEGEEYHISDIAVATVRDAATARTLAASVTTRKIKGHSAKCYVRENADGTATVLMEISKPGFVMVVR